ncbi:MAG: ABC transporter substrate-binding protein [Dehalococcoidales bacterium]|nr:ABC transporter substrate-binding protein [Dehalococcoidales bacterium]
MDLLKKFHVAKMMVSVLLIVLVMASFLSGCSDKENKPIGMAVEFMDHAACAYIAQDQGWYEDEGLELAAYESYATGIALAAALARDDIQVAYLCLVPAINVYANAGVPVKIVAGTHKYGYGLVVNPEIISSVDDLEGEGLRIGCVKEGGAVDVVLQKTIDVYDLDREKVLANIQRMSPQKMALAIKAGQLDGAFMPEHWATLGESFRFEMLLTSRDIWPEMQGSVLLVKESLLNEHPDIVKKLVKVSQKATDWINDTPEDSAEIIAFQLNSAGEELLSSDSNGDMSGLEITPEVLMRSMERLDFTTDIDVEKVQETIDYAFELGYITERFDAEEILDLRFID